MQTQFTPGPWKIEEFSCGSFSIWGGDGDGFFPVCTRQKSLPSKEDEAIANARLIAAAPDMLAALRDCTLQLQYLADKFGETGTGAQVLARVNAAIAKAEGR